MKLLVVILQGLLLEVLAQEKCRRENGQTRYYIYNANVEIKAYNCLLNVSDDFNCENSHRGKTVKDYTSDNIDDLCLSIDSGSVNYNKIGPGRYYSISDGDINVTLCELSAQTNLLDDRVTFPEKERLYSKGHYYDNINNNSVFWLTGCQNLPLVYKGLFDVWKITQNNSIYITNNHVSLQLSKSRKLCDFDIWTTNNDGIIASNNRINTSISGNLPQLLQSTLGQHCGFTEEGTDKAVQNSVTAVPKSWYVYSYIVDVTVYFCISNSSYCQELGLGKPVPKITDNFKWVNSSACMYQKPVSLLCESTLKVDLRNDKINRLPDCNYSDGFCSSNQAFWKRTSCREAVEELYKDLRKECTQTNCVIVDFNNVELILEERGTLCSELVWFTNQSGVVVSQSKFKCLSDDEKLHSTEWRDKISDLQTALRYLVLVAIFVVLWYVFNVMVNLSTLWRARKWRKSKSPFYLLNCISQGLTSRYLYFNQRNGDTATEFQPPQLYETVK